MSTTFLKKSWGTFLGRSCKTVEETSKGTYLNQLTRRLQKWPCLRAETPLRRAGMGKPLYKASDGDEIDI
jgi:hypothetical protein